MTRIPMLLPAAALALLLALPSVASAATERGVYWEEVVEMEMPGMPMAMPPQTMKVCLPAKDWDRPPEAKKDPNCEVNEFKRSGDTVTWKMVCTGKNAMTGSGEVTRSGDTFSGHVQLQSAQGAMNMKMRGKKLGGDCDLDELKKKGEAVKKQVETQQAEMKIRQAESERQACETGVKQMQVGQLFGQFAPCKDAARHAEFCARLKTPAGYRLVMAQAQQEKSTRGMMPGPEAAAKACKVDLAATRVELCAGAARGEDLGFLADSCPEQAKVIAKRECAGRKYTELAAGRYGTFCAKVWGTRQDEQAQDDEEVRPAKKQKKKEESEEGAVDKGKKLLKGLGF